MSAALKLRPTSLPLPAIPVPVDPLSLLPDHARIEAERCLAIIRPALIRVQQGVSVRAAAMWLATSATGMPSAPTIQRWLKDYLTGGVVELAPKYTGRQRKERGWEARAAELFNQPQKPAYATVAYWLRKEGFADASEHNVRRYLKALPSNLTETGKKRLGAHFYAQNIRPHKVRDNTVLPVGFVYQGDGHCCDVCVAHPATGRPFRPELTTWIDVRSQRIVSWWISESESAHTTLFSLSQALVAHDHVPAYVHTDPGSGFKAKLISDEVTGFLVRFNIEPMLALPGNARGKGLKEGWFRWFEERCGKTFDTYCGHDRSDDFLRHLTEKVKRGVIVLPTLQQYIDKIREYVDSYNGEPHEGTAGKTPDELWQQLDQVKLHTPTEAIIRPRMQRTVQRWSVRLDNRRYRAGDLAQFEGREVIVEYSIHCDERVWVHDLKGRFVCEALLVEKTPWLPASRIEQAQQKRLEGQRQRHLRAIAEQEARARMPLTAAAMVDAIEHDVAPAPALSSAALTQRHSIHVVAATEPAAPISRAPDAADLQLVREALNAQPEVEEAPEQRFMRWLQLREIEQASGEIPADVASWYRSYPDSAEFQGLADVYEAFGYLPGAHHTQAAHAQES
jgi:putative transposase